MNQFDNINSDLTPIGVIVTATSWLNIFGIVEFNPFMQSIVYVLTIAWLTMQIVGYLKKQYKKKS
jgi:hypothetical protein